MPKKVGRPPGKIQDRPFQMKVNDAFMAQVDDWRKQQPDMPSRAEAIRRMVALVAARGRTGRQPMASAKEATAPTEERRIAELEKKMQAMLQRLDAPTTKRKRKDAP
jgi:hypothetical protein